MKLSEEIKRKAVKLHKSRRREGLSSSLTQVQHELARKEGFQNFKHLKSQEIASETAARKADALNGTSGDPNLLKTLNEDLGIFMMQNGHRGVKALRPFDKGERVLFEKPTYWFSLGQDTLGYGLVWGLTGHIALNFPQALNEMLNSGFRWRFYQRGREAHKVLKPHPCRAPRELRSLEQASGSQSCQSPLIPKSSSQS